MSGPIKRRRRWVLLWAQRCICPACDGVLNPSAKKLGPDYPTLDHMVPQHRFGANAMSNLLVKHRRCNEARADSLEISEADRLMLALVAERLTQRPTTWRECRHLVLTTSWRIAA
jgi:hypothetical protein